MFLVLNVIREDETKTAFDGYCLLGYAAMKTGANLLMFHRSVIRVHQFHSAERGNVLLHKVGTYLLDDTASH
jgi:hypothetical protein